MLGEQNSTTTVSASFDSETIPYSLLLNALENWFNQKLSTMVRFRNPLTVLKSLSESQFFIKNSPISFAVCSGPFLEKLKKGNTTRVMSPLNSFLVFCN